MSSELPEGFDSIFRYISVVSQRAEQLICGAKMRSDSRKTKPTLQAKDDVDQGLVEWRILTQEEIDAQRQAIVDQFRAEVGAEDMPAIGAPVPDVLQTSQASAEATADEQVEERDDELARLQRLLGLGGGKPEASERLEDEAENGDEDSYDLPDDSDLTLDVEDEESFEDISSIEDMDDMDDMNEDE